MDRYPPIADHGLIGDLQTAALVTTDGTVDWFCCPRFDSPSVFASLLDHERGGHFRIAPEGDDYVARQLYFPDTAILITRFMTPGRRRRGPRLHAGRRPAAGHRPAPAGPGGARASAARCGSMSSARRASTTAAQAHELELTDEGAVFRTPTLQLTLHGGAGRGRCSATANDVRGRADACEAGQTGGVMLESAADGPPRTMTPDELLDLFTDTARFWRGWLGRSTYRGRWREMVERSAITLKLMTYAPTGALVAAPTAGLPEQVGGERNWDYRYTWIRDASFSVHALLGLGFTDEAAAFGGWLGDRAAEQAGDGSGPLKIMYRVDGSLRPGRGDPRPPRGLPRLPAGADRQRRRRPAPARHLRRGAGLGLPGRPARDPGRPRRLGQAAPSSSTGCASNWDQPDEGIWETRGGRQDFTYGRLMCWVAFDRAIRLAARARPARRPGPLDRPSATRSTARSWTAAGTRSGGAFVQHYEHRRARRLAAAHAAGRLRRPHRPDVAVDPGRHGRRAGLRQPGLPLRPQRLPRRAARLARAPSRSAPSGTSTPWPARAGSSEARLTFEKMLTYANHLGLYSEEIGADRRAARQLPAGVQPPLADQRRHQPRPPARPAVRSPGRDEVWRLGRAHHQPSVPIPRGWRETVSATQQVKHEVSGRSRWHGSDVSAVASGAGRRA